MKERVLLSWSGGKDSALALHELRKSGKYEVAALLTTITRDYDRICMHGVRSILLEQQAESLALPLEKIFLSKNASNEEYESSMRQILERYRAEGVCGVVFGDIFLEDLKRYRQEKLSQIGMKGLFPIWKRDTAELACAFIDLGFEAIVTCADSNLLDSTLVGRPFDEQFLSTLPEAVDPCGENGEFHSFVSDGPIFQRQIPHTTGEVVLRENGFYYCDLVPAATASKG
ncbi:MAG: diphthine--ammonia ligase [Planctomycetes bacterium]|nr:diphthine--ammonia ligase [Planctomycetota bacterium]MBL7187104.1 diphthine--ammonia ligase [Phycisphaerae bacterium]